MARQGKSFQVGDRTLSVTKLDKVLYPETGTTKADVIHYYLSVADVLIPQITRRPVTRKRWVDGVGTEKKPGEVFFRKDLEDSAPEWIPTGSIEHKSRTNTYPIADEPAVLAWFAQVAALELHTPQWRFGRNGQPRNPDRLVLDLDPGEGVGLAECAEVAFWCREILDDMGMATFPVTSGSKGIHLYAGLDGTYNSEQVSKVAHELAKALEADHPDEVISTMKRADRAGKVFLDWSQNSAAKTTVSPYSLRGRLTPMIAAPRTWEELEARDLRQLTYEEVLERVEQGIDPISDLGADRLDTYRSMRDASKTAEPVPAQRPSGGDEDQPSFVIQEHHASSLHWDFRLEYAGVLVSWAVPKGVPLKKNLNRLAVQTEDHPLEYGTFEGTIAKGEYGAGEVSIWDTGTYEREKWRDGKEVIATLHGRDDGGLGGVPRRFALIRTKGMGDDSWLMQLMKDQPDDHADPEPEEALSVADLPGPMLCSVGKPADVTLGKKDGETWAFEMKWDGYRVIAGVGKNTVVLSSRNGKDLTDLFPQACELTELIDDEAVLDGELVALDEDGRPDFSLLQAVLKGDDEVSEDAELRYMVFDILRLGDRSLTKETYEERRKILAEHLAEGENVVVPPNYTGSLAAATKASSQLGLEGVVAKRMDSTYLPGKRASAWLKLKTRQHQEVIVIGVREGKGSRSGSIGSLLVAVPDESGELRYAGRVGTGFTDSQLAEIETTLRRIERKTPPIDDVPAEDSSDAWWVTPKLVAEVALAGRTRHGRVRQAAWRGLRQDKDIKDVRWEV
ncbi:ATP-dependent DNA ligase [Bowdeniella massiliensis]|uniref:ATP-dependent DNA ligase n=1 Tax=Bowdeniella massiliensis TaxID=2932264 RepID=UPI0020294D4B|nr:ATP-dependent DNA ligase [Bowdeniella massiliensis]